MYFVEVQFSIFLTTVSDLISPPEEAHGASICVTLMHAEIRYLFVFPTLNGVQSKCSLPTAGRTLPQQLLDSLYVSPFLRQPSWLPFTPSERWQVRMMRRRRQANK